MTPAVAVAAAVVLAIWFGAVLYRAVAGAINGVEDAIAKALDDYDGDCG